MPKRNDALLIEDIKQSIDKIQSYTHGLDFNTFFSDEKTKDAVIRNLEIIGEVANKLSPDFLLHHPSIEWYKIAAFRNRLIHEYFGVDYQVVWQIINTHLIHLRQYLYGIK